VPVLSKILRAITVSAFALPLAALAAAPITGTVTNKTNGKPAVGDTVTLIRLQQGMQDSTTTKTDARGHYKLEVPEEGLHLVRVTHEKANYFQPVTEGTTKVDLTVYDAAPKVDGVVTNVEEFHISATATELQVVEVLDVLNQSSPAVTQFGPTGFDFYLPTNAHLIRSGAMTEGGKLPVPATAVPVGDPGHYTFIFPIRPGETQFGIIFTVPYSGSYEWQPKLVNPVNTLAVVLPSGMKLMAKENTPFRPQTSETPGTQTFAAQHISPGQPASFTLSGTGDLPESKAASEDSPNGTAGDGTIAATDNKAPGKGLDNPLDPEGNREPLAKYKGWILIGLAILLVAAAAILLRKPAALPTVAPAAASPLPVAAYSAANHNQQLLQVLKEELFALETDRLQERIAEPEYLQQKAALELILRRALGRTTASQA
jgi:5-hydroxyisourate hydrolase-like protein (transthyretin family)